jgi:hypothetical protein
MTQQKYRRVWLLGAGFSASLGAPLLNDLLSFRVRRKLVHAGLLEHAAEALDPGPARGTVRLQELVYALYHHGTGYPEGYLLDPHEPTPRSEKGLWRHAEEYLERLDDLALSQADEYVAKLRERFLLALRASGSGVMKTLVDGLSRGDLPPISAGELAREARRIVAAECCEFLRGVSSRSERAKPYVHWLQQLGGSTQDTLITFNYDCVVEKLSREVNREVLVACAGGDLEQQEHRSRSVDCPMLIKLHGSVDWERKPSEAPDGFPFRQSEDIEYAAQNADGQIATPGGSKLAASEGALKPLWALANRKLVDAQEVVFIGYRIPESDAAAREMLLDAFEANEQTSLFVRIVLGRPSFDRDRLESLLKVAFPGRFGGVGRRIIVITVDAWAEDYLQAWRRPPG